MQKQKTSTLQLLQGLSLGFWYVQPRKQQSKHAQKSESKKCRGYSKTFHYDRKEKANREIDHPEHKCCDAHSQSSKF